MTDYTKAWESLPERVRDKLGTDEDLTVDDLDALVGAAVVYHAEWSNDPSTGDWYLHTAFREAAAEALEAEAEQIDRMSERVEVGKVPIDDPARRPDPSPMTDDEVHAAGILRARAERLRDNGRLNVVGTTT